MSTQKAQGELHNLLEKDNEEEDEDNDMIEIQLQSSIIKVNFVNLFTYSKLVRDEYQTINEARLGLSKRFHDFQKDFNISDDNSILFFSSFKKANFPINNQNYSDLCKLSTFFKVKKLTKILKQYENNHSIDTSFIINEILKQISNEARDNYENDNFSPELESKLSGKADECLQNEKFELLPISVVYRILSKSEKEISSDLLLDFISKSIESRCALLSFLNIENLSESKLGELFDLYDQNKDKENDYFRFLPTNLKLLKAIKDENKELRAQVAELREKCSQQQKMEEAMGHFINHAVFDDAPSSFFVYKILPYLNSCSEKGDMAASYLLGALYHKCDEKAKSFSYLEKAADQGSIPALYKIALMLEGDDSVEKKDSKVFECLQELAAKGETYALVYLGMMYEEGNGVEKDHAKALECCRQAEENGDSEALNMLSNFYIGGTIVEQDERKGIRCLKKSAELGDWYSLQSLGLMYEECDDEQILHEALVCYEKANKIFNTSGISEAIERIKGKISENNQNK